MSISTQSFTGNQQQHFRSTNSRFIENNGPRLRFPPPPGTCISTSGESFNTQLSNSHWTNSDRNTYSIVPQITQSAQNEQQVLTSQLFQKHQLISVLVSQQFLKLQQKNSLLYSTD